MEAGAEDCSIPKMFWNLSPGEFNTSRVEAVTSEVGWWI